jgi:hypothetical protein
MTAADNQFAERILVGPRRGGRDYDVLATSPGLRLAVEDLGRIRRHNFEVRPFVRAGGPVWAFFRLRSAAPEAWLIATTSLHSEINGNPVWITSGLAVTRDVLDVIGWRVLPIASPWIGDVPASGSSLKAAPIHLTVPSVTGWTTEVAIAHAVQRLARTRLAVETPVGEQLAVLTALLELAPSFRRSGLSFITAPPHAGAPEDPPELAVFDVGARGPSTLKGYELVSLVAAEGAPVPLVTADGWDEFLELAAVDRLPIVEGLDRTSRSLPLNAALPVQADMQLRIETYLDGLPGPAEQADALFYLVKAAHRVRDPQSRGQVVGALIKAFEKRVKASSDPHFWLAQYLLKIDAVMKSVGPPLLAARLAVETGAAFGLEGDLTERIAPAIAEKLAAAAADQLTRVRHRTAASLSTLLEAVFDRLAEAPGEPNAIRLGLGLADAIGADARLRGADARSGRSIAGFINRLIFGRQLSFLSLLRQSPNLGALRTTAAADAIENTLTEALQAVRIARPASRSDLATTLAVWRLGKVWLAR